MYDPDDSRTFDLARLQDLTGQPPLTPFSVATDGSGHDSIPDLPAVDSVLSAIETSDRHVLPSDVAASENSGDHVPDAPDEFFASPVSQYVPI